MDVQKNIKTALDRILGRSKSGELDGRIDIQKNLKTAQRQIATSPLIDPTVFSDKGMSQGSLYVDGERSQGASYAKYTERETIRNARYFQYDKMDVDLVASALDVYANEATQKDSNRKIITVSSDSQYIKQELEDLIDRLQLNSNKTWGIIRSMCKYGDYFTSMKLDSRHGVVALKALDPSTVYRVDEGDRLVGYVQDLDATKQNMRLGNMSGLNTNNPYVNYNVLNMPSFTNGRRSDDKQPNHELFRNYELLHFRVTGRDNYVPYGTSVLDPAVDPWKKLDLLTDSLVIYRINKAPSRYVFYVDNGNNQGGAVDNHMKKAINDLTKKEYYDAQGKINERYQLLDMNANIFIPITKNNPNSRVEMLQGAGAAVGEIEDVQYFNDRLFSALKVPKAFLGFAGDVSGKGMLSQQNVTFSKSVQNIQADFLETIKDLCLIHLGILGITDKKSLESFTLAMTVPSYIEEQARLSSETERLNLATAYKNFGVDTEWAVRNILGKSGAEFRKMFPNGVQAMPGEDGGLGGMGLGMGGGMGGGMDLGGMDMGGGMPAPDTSGLDALASGGAAGAPMPDMSGGGQPLLQHFIPTYGSLIMENNLHTAVTYNKLRLTDAMKLAVVYESLNEQFGINKTVLTESTTK